MPLPFKKVKKKNSKETIKYQKIAWQNPLEIAQKISQNYHENWVFLYSALNKKKANSKSYIALFENQKYCGNDFAKLQEIIENNDKEIWFGSLSYEVASQFENLPKTTKSSIDIEQIFFSKFDLVLEFNHDKQQITAIFNNKIFLEKFLNYKFLNIKYQTPIVKEISSNFNDE